jgi:hypothetical protein
MIEAIFAACLVSLRFACPFWLAALGKRESMNEGKIPHTIQSVQLLKVLSRRNAFCGFERVSKRCVLSA